MKRRLSGGVLPRFMFDAGATASQSPTEPQSLLGLGAASTLAEYRTVRTLPPVGGASGWCRHVVVVFFFYFGRRAGVP